MVHSGINKHSANCLITTANDRGYVLKEARGRNTVDAVSGYFRCFGTEPHRAVVESTTGWYLLDHLVTSLWIELILAHAMFLKAIAYAKVR